MKKTVSLMIMLVFLFSLAACGGGKDKTTDPKQTDKTTNPDVNDETYDLGGIDFVVMCDVAAKCDPRQAGYERLFKTEKIDLVSKAEAKYNIKIVYKSYPSEASWGGARERWIIEQTSLGKSAAHIYELTSYQIANLAVQNAISPLDDYIEAYGSDLFWPESKAYGEVRGSHYTYHDNYPMADDGLYYNADLLARYLGEGRRNEPTELWLAGEWDWDAFRKVATELNEKLDEERAVDEGGPQYVLGGRSYNWSYQMIGANGGHLINPDLSVGITSDETVNALNFLNELRSTPGMWLDNAPLSNASQPEFKDGNIAFHNGQSYWIFQDNKWNQKDFKLGFVPYPTGDNTKADLSNYYINNIYGLAAFVISSAYSKDLIPEGYEDLMIHDETIFKVWADLQFFPPVDPDTGYGNVDDVTDDFYIKRLFPYYGDEKSREAHLEVIGKSYPDNFYSLSEANNHNEAAYMIKIQAAIQEGDVRNKMIALESEIKAGLTIKYNLPTDFYN